MLKRILFAGLLLSGILIAFVQKKDAIVITAKQINSKLLWEGTPAPVYFNGSKTLKPENK